LGFCAALRIPTASEAALRKKTATMGEIVIKALRHFEDMQPAVELQKIYWGDDAEALVPAHMLYSLAAMCWRRSMAVT